MRSIHASEYPVTRRRRSQDARWSASFSLTVVDGKARTSVAVDVCDADLESSLNEMVGRAQFRWRFEGKARSRSVKLADGVDKAVEFRNLLRVAIAEDWDLDGSTPFPPRPNSSANATPAIVASAGTDTDEPSEGPDGRVVALPDMRQEPASTPPSDSDPLFDLNRTRTRDLSTTVEELDTFTDLVTWRIAEIAKTNARGKSRKRRGNTLSNAEAELRFADDYFRAGTATNGFPNSSRLLTGVAAIDSDDCIDFVTYRKHVNLRTRSKNELEMRAWTRSVKAALSAGAPLPGPPAMEAEVASERTIEATTKTVAAAFKAAFTEDLIPVNPWAPRVTARVEAPPRTHFTERLMPSPGTVDDIVTTVTSMTRRSTVDHQPCTVTGERYAFFVLASFVLHLRPEEARALRDSSWVLDHPTLPPHVIVREATPMVPVRFSADGKSHETAELKARGLGDERRLWLSPEMTEAARRHRADFVPTPEPKGASEDERDPRWFTTHNGALIDPANFNEAWWRPLMATVTAAHPVCEGMPFRYLRHAGITVRILAGDPIDVIADEAGNTPEVIRTSYRGVIDAVDTLASRRIQQIAQSSGDGLDALLAGDMTPNELRSRLDALSSDAQLEAKAALQAVLGMLDVR